MFGLKKLLCALTALVVSMLVFQQSKAQQNSLKVEGRTMATTYSIVYFDQANRDLKNAIDSLLAEINEGINTYDSLSEISRFNKSTRGIVASHHFRKATQLSLKIAEASHGNFDPTVMPLVNLWGFGPQKNVLPSAEKVDSIRNFVGHRFIEVKGDSVVKLHPLAQLDFGGIGQGYGVDIIREFLRGKHIQNFLIELGGEGYAAGRNLATAAPWKVGIIDPGFTREEQQLIGYAELENSAFTTSGNYFNYRIIDGKKIGHTISPFTGWPVASGLISISVFAVDCAEADAWATAFMVAGKETALKILEGDQKIGALMICDEPNAPRIFISSHLRRNIFLDPVHDR